MKKRLISGLIFVLVISCGFYFIGAESLAAAAAVQADPSRKPAKWAELERAVRKKVAAFKGDVGLIIKDLDTGWTIRINPDKLFPSASMIKVPIMASCMKAAREGRLSLRDQLKLAKSDKVKGSGVLWMKRTGSIYSVEELIELMVTHSDNTAANIIIDLLGFDYLNRCFKAMGLEKTNLSRKMMDFRARTRGIENYTTAREMADILEMIYLKAYICPDVSEKCLDVLKSQTVNDRIPRLLPKNTVVAHKTGLEKQVCHDAGIIFTDQGDILISVFTRTTSGSRTAKRFIAAASSLAYKACREAAAIPMAGISAGGGKTGR